MTTGRERRVHRDSKNFSVRCGTWNPQLSWRLCWKRVSSAMHQRIFHGLVWVFFAGGATICPAEDSTNSDTGWKQAGHDKDLVIYSRPHPGSAVKEFKAIGSVDAPTYAVCAVIDDFQNYPKFMP